METAAHSSSRPSLLMTLRDLAALAKPRITLMVVITGAGGLWLAPGDVSPVQAMWTLGAMATLVMGANALNCYIERDSDRLMTRTAKRPLPDRRMAPWIALVFGLVFGFGSVPMLVWRVNLLTGMLGLVALVSYVAIYTPMKRFTSMALLVGSIPGALPPLMGWTAVTNELSAPGWVLFAILFLWQVPHFIAISIFRQEDYERAGLKVLPSTGGMTSAKAQAVFYTIALVVASWMLFPLRVAGVGYLVVATICGAAFLGTALLGLRQGAAKAWARRLFGVSLVYLTVLFIALMVDAR